MREPKRTVAMSLTTYQRLVGYLQTLRPRPSLVEIVNTAIEDWLEQRTAKK